MRCQRRRHLHHATNYDDIKRRVTQGLEGSGYRPRLSTISPTHDSRAPVERGAPEVAAARTCHAQGRQGHWAFTAQRARQSGEANYVGTYQAAGDAAR
eukprot:1543351-Pyramimonas_sp.AAC.1